MAVKFYECESCRATFHCITCKGTKSEICAEKLKELCPDTVEAAHEKHIPVVKEEGNKVHVFIGEVEHPMIEEHYIEWIAIETEQGMQVKHLNPGEKPEASFLLTEDDSFVAAYEFCNLHGLWKKDRA